MKRWIVVAALLVILIATAWFLLFRKSGPEYEFRFDTVSQGDITMYVTATGTINAVVTVEVGTQVSGIVEKLYADFNSVVKARQVIAQIDPTFLQQSVKDATASLERARAQYNDAKRVLERTKTLFDKKLESQVNYDAALTQFESNQAVLKQAEASLDRAKINLAYATIYAPVNGVVIDRKVNVGQTVAASFSSPTLYTIANDLHKMQVETTVDESDIGRISVGQEATFTVDAYPDDRFVGTVSQVRLAPLSIQNVVNYTVIIDVNNTELKLMPGMTANVKILVGSAPNVLRVSNLALRFQPPVPLIDSARVRELRDGGAGMGAGTGMGGDGRRGMRGEGGDRGGPPMGGGEPGTDDRRARMRVLRDSVMAAHGGTLSDEEMRAEMGKLFARDKVRGASQSPAAKVVPPRPSSEARYGIDNIFPEYQKSAYTPSRQVTRGRVWILNSHGKLEPIVVRTGLSDGRQTEISADSLKSGDQIVVGATAKAELASKNGANPLAPTQQRPMGGGRP